MKIGDFDSIIKLMLCPAVRYPRSFSMKSNANLEARFVSGQLKGQKLKTSELSTSLVVHGGFAGVNATHAAFL